VLLLEGFREKEGIHGGFGTVVAYMLIVFGPKEVNEFWGTENDGR
jgi:hypothetical protein